MAGLPDLIPVRVCVRCRPFNTREKNEKATECIQFYIESNQLSCNGKMFTFDSVMDPSTDQQSAYELTVQTLLDSFLKGFNCTILAYGQTGSGKTYTMGTAETTESITSSSRGIVPRFVEDLFNKISTLNSENETYKVTVSMLEIYDEKIRDLLTVNAKDKEGLQAREINGVVTVPGLTVKDVSNLRETMAALEEGCQQRSMGGTAMNAVSSRSHAIFRIDLEKTSLSDEGGPSFKAKLHLVDLAGSERIKKTQAEGTRLKEGIRINEGLLALGNVISALSEPGGGNRHIPYRDSKITRLLQDSLGGNSYTVMIACISPADTNAEETISTLRYADRAKKIKNKPVVIVDQDKNIIKQLREQISQLQREIAQFRSGNMPNANTSVDIQESAHLKDLLSEKTRLLALEESKAAEIMIQKLNVTRQLIKYEEDRERISQILKESENKETIVTQLMELMDHQIEDQNIDAVDFEAASGGEDGEDEEDLDEKAAKLADNQKQLDSDLQDIMKRIKQREEEIKRAGEDKENYMKLLKEHEIETSALQQKIDSLTSLMAEKEMELKKHTTGNKLAEERRRKLMEMDKQLQAYRKQMSDLKRVEVQKVQCEENMKKMQKEILEMKQLRVKMFKQLKVETNKYMECKSKMERQVAQLKAKERKREGEHARETRAKDMQLQILKHKLDESKKLAKRLETQRGKLTSNMDIQVTDDKAIKVIKNCWIDELNLLGSSYEAELLCSILKEQRKKIISKINKLKNMIEEPATKKRRDSEGVSLPSVLEETRVEEINREIVELESQQSGCTVQLKTLQEGCTKIEPDRIYEIMKEKNVHTVATAYKLLKTALELCVTERKNSIELGVEVKNGKQRINELDKEVKKQNAAQRQLANSYKNKEAALSRQFNKNISEVQQKYSSLLAVLSNRKDMEPGEVANAVESAVQKLSENTQPVEKNNEMNVIETRCSIKAVERFGDVRDTLEAVDVSGYMNKTYNVDDVSWHPTPAAKKKKTKNVPVDISPIKPCNSNSGENEMVRRRSRLVDKTKPAKLEIVEMENISEEGPANATFVKEPSSLTTKSNENVRPMIVRKQHASLGQLNE